MAKRKSPKQRKEERQQEKRRGQQTLIIGAVVLVAIFAAIIFALTSLPSEAPIPADLDKYDRFMQSRTDEGYPLLGNPDAPVTVREFSSFSCPGCLDFHSSVFPNLLDDIEAGRINFVFVPLQTVLYRIPVVLRGQRFVQAHRDNSGKCTMSYSHGTKLMSIQRFKMDASVQVCRPSDWTQANLIVASIAMPPLLF